VSGSVQVRTEEGAVVVRVSFKLRKRGAKGRKLVLHDGDKPARPVARHEHATILKALGRAWRWKRMLESGDFASITDLAKAEKINHAYVRRILRLTLLCPEITEAILSNRLMGEAPLQHLLRSFSDVWAEQAGSVSRSAVSALGR